MGYGRKIAIAAALGFTLRLSGFAFASAAEDAPALNILQYAVPISVSMVCMWYLLNRRRAVNIFNPRKLFFKRVKTSEAEAL